MRYDYQYDLAGRLLQADFDEYFGGTWTNSQLDYTVKNISYDLNGNMLSMQQYGMGVVDTALQPVVLDYLTYTYHTNSNRLLRVSDTVTTDYLAGDFIDGYTSTTDYVYDASGSLVMDRNKAIDEVTYTFFNKPEKVYFQDGSKIEYIYNAAGVKLRETVIPDSGAAYKRDYVGTAVYKDDSLVYISTPQGRTVYDEATDIYTEELFVKDHLGNVRSIIAIEPVSFTLEYLATYELSSAYTEGILFDVIGEIREEDPEGGNYSGRLRADEYP
ncbi:hypothetical protein LWM68_20230 [Niabella sp. W65]|nr:hypothetical protein [Niabella sp. W65]MCH7364884.1 hypothetical protein [Niabella sp. W65]